MRETALSFPYVHDGFQVVPTPIREVPLGEGIPVKLFR